MITKLLESYRISDNRSHFEMTRILPTLLLILVVGACEPEERAPTGRSPKETVPRYRPVRIFVNNKNLSPTHGCDGPFTGVGPMLCGPTDSPMRVDWKFVQSKPEGDMYQISFALRQGETDPVDAVGGISPNSATTVLATTFVYVGEPVVVFENESQIVLIYTGTNENRPTITDAIRRAPGV